MGSTVVAIPEGEELPLPIQDDQKNKFSFVPMLSMLRGKINKRHMRKLMHSVKVGIALVLVSLLYLLDPLYNQVGENAAWAIMTVIVVFEFYAGATLSKGLNRGVGTVLGGGLGCFAASLAQKVDGNGKLAVVGCSLFIFGAAATYCRLVPSVKKRWDYGVMIFVLTFNLVVVTGIRENVMEVTRDRLLTIAMGFALCIFISLLVFPTWASDELHESTASRFLGLADSIEGSLQWYFTVVDDKENQLPNSNFKSPRSILNSKSSDESLANFARWEPWHGMFGLQYPWKKYITIGDLLREVAGLVISLQSCLQSPRQPPAGERESIREWCEAVGSSLCFTLRELGESLEKMRRSQTGTRLKSMRQETSLSPCKLGVLEDGDGVSMTSVLFLMAELVEKVENLAKTLEELEEIAGFHAIQP